MIRLSDVYKRQPTALTADYANGKASFTMQANMAEAYKTVYSNYHTPAGTDPVSYTPLDVYKRQA